MLEDFPFYLKNKIHAKIIKEKEFISQYTLQLFSEAYMMTSIVCKIKPERWLKLLMCP